MGMDYYLACKRCNVSVWAWWRNSGRGCGPATTPPATIQAFIDEHYGHELTLLNEDDESAIADAAPAPSDLGQ